MTKRHKNVPILEVCLKSADRSNVPLPCRTKPAAGVNNIVSEEPFRFFISAALPKSLLLRKQCFSLHEVFQLHRDALPA